MAKNTSFPRSSQYSFARVPTVDIPRSQFDRSHGLKTTFDEAELIPIYWDEALPGDTFRLRMSSFCRMGTLTYVPLDNIYMDFFFFAVPNRLVWDNWQKFCGEQTDPGDSIDYTVPQNNGSSAHGAYDIESYFGIPYGQGASDGYNTLHLRAYNLIFNEWFRDENLVDSVGVPTGDGPDAHSFWAVLKRAKRHDYFTSCLPWMQKGDAVELPLGSTAPVVAATPTQVPLFDVGTTTDNRLTADAADSDRVSMLNAVTGSDDLQWGSETGLSADLSSATAATINQIREAFQVQKLLEKDARGGSRYTEILRSHFGVVSPDQRLQRPEYLGGGSTKINVHQVSATSGYSSAPDVGDLSAFATQMSDGIGFVKSFTEHCVLIGLVNVRADMTYQQGLDRMWSRQTRYDYYWPSLAHLGEQAVLNKEIYWSANPTVDDAAFGYQERYAEYRYKPSRVTGKFHSNVSGSLDAWHLGLDFASLPALNQTFIEEQPPIDRVLVTPSEPHFLADFWFDLKCVRPMPTFSVPGLIDHF